MNRYRLLILSAVSISVGFGALPAHAGPQGLPSAIPPSSNPGECYARVKIPAVYNEDRQGVVVKDGYTSLQVSQPRLQSRTEQVMVKEPSTRFRVRQPSYRNVTEQILVRPGYEKLSVSEPQFSTVRETLQTSAPRLVWKKGNPGELRARGYKIHSTADGRMSGGYGSGSADQQAFYGAGLGGQECGPGCEIWCLVEEPGEISAVSRRIMTSPGEVIRTPVPPKYQTINKQVLADPGGVEEIPVPAEYRALTIEDIIEPGQVFELSVPPEYASVGMKTLISPERYEWRRVLCAPGTGTMPSTNYSHSSQNYGQSYGTAHSGSNSYQSSYGSDYSSVPQGYVRTTESARFGVFQDTQPTYPPGTKYDYKTGYYGTEDYPAYQKAQPPRR